jgi:VWFA-related protein
MWLALPALALVAAAQEPPVPSFPARAERVVVDVVVTDRNGVPVTGLAAADFEVSEDGERQRIVTFEAIASGAPPPAGPVEAAAEPATTPGPVAGPGQFYAVAFDDVNMTPFKVHEAKAAVAAFVRSAGDDDRILFMATRTGDARVSASASSRGELLDMVRGLKAGHLPDMSPDRISDYEAMLIHVLQDAETLARVNNRIASRTGGGRMSTKASAAETYERAAARTRDSLRALERLIETIVAEKGRKSVILVSEGFILSPRVAEFRDVTQAAMRANAALYFVDARRMELGASEYAIEAWSAQAADIAKALAERAGEAFGSETLAKETGGFTITNTNDLAAGMRRIAAETRSYYLIGYDPTKEPDGRFRKIRVRVSRKGVRVRARRGYYAESPVANPGR